MDWQNSGLIEAGTFGINTSRVFFNNNQTGILKAGHLWSNGYSLHNSGEIQVTQGISLNSCHNQGTGKIYGENLALNIQQSLYNDGQIITHGLRGVSFANRGNVRLTGTAENPSQIAVKRFENLSPNAATRQNPNSLPVKVIGSHIVVAPQNEAFITQPGSEIIAKSLVFTPLANPAGKEAAANNAFDNKGSIGSLENPLEVLVINRQGSVNFGSIRTLSFTAEGWRFQNAKGAKLHVGKFVEARLTVFQNDGEMLVDQGTFTQQAGEFINTGKWDHQGDIELGSTALRNTNGTLIWQKGKWSFAPCEHVNNGEWVLDQMACSQPLAIQNYATLHLKSGAVTFAKLVNHKNLIFSAGQYTVTDAFQNNHLLGFVENDWAFTDDASHPAPNRLVLTGNAAKAGVSAAGEMESGKTLIYDIQSLPKSIRSEGDVTFSPRHRQSRTLADLARVMARGKVAFYTPAITTTQNYEFGGIGHLDLYVGGLFTTHHSFKCLELALDVDGPLTCGASNSVMGEIAATGYGLVFKEELPKDGKPLPNKIYIEQQGDRLKYTVQSLNGLPVEEFLNITMDGTLKEDGLKALRASILEEIAERSHILPRYGSLTVKAHNVDNRFGKIYGAGPTHIQSTKGDILVGAAAQGTTRAAHVGNYTNRVLNGAYIASGDSLALESPTNILVDYGQLFSGASQNLKAQTLIRNTAGRISALGTIQLASPRYTHTRGGIINIGCDCGGGYTTDGTYYGWAHSNLSRQCPVSGPATLEGLEDIIFNVSQVDNVASTIASGTKILIGNGILADSTGVKKLPQYVEQIYQMGMYARHDRGGYAYHWGHPWKESCSLQAGQVIQINTGDAIITSDMNSPFIAIQVNKGLFSHASCLRQDTNLSDVLLINMNDFIKGSVQGKKGLFYQKADAEIVSEFPLGKPSLPQPSQVVTLSHPNFPQGLNPGGMGNFPHSRPRIFNPLRSLNLNLWIQQALSQMTGKVHLRNHAGERISGNSLAPELWSSAGQWRAENKKDMISREELASASTAMLLYGLRQVEGGFDQLTYLAVPPGEINNVKGISGDVIDIRASEDLAFQDATVKARHYLNLYAEEMSFGSTATTHSHANGSYQTIDNPTQVECTEGPLTAIGRKGFQMTGSSLRALLNVVAGSTEGETSIQDAQLKREDHFTEEEDDGLFGSKTTRTTHVTTTSRPSEVVSERQNVTIVSGKESASTITGSYLKALQAVIFEGKKVETRASVGVNSTTVDTEKDGMFSSTSSHSFQQTASLFPTVIQAESVHTNTKEAAYHGTDFIADILYDNTEKGAYFGFTLATLEYFHQTVSESAFAKTDIGCKGWYEVMQPCRLAVNQIVRKIDEGEIRLDSVVWDKDRTQIIGKFAETTYELKKWHTEWAIHEQLIPDEALVVVALAVSVATYGAGTGVALATSCGLEIAATGTGAAIANAGAATLFSSATASFLRTGDPIATAKEVFSPQNLKALGISMASAGICSELGSILKIETNPGLAAAKDSTYQPGFLDFAEATALNTAATVPLNIAVGGEEPGEATLHGLKTGVVNTIGQFAAYQIGNAYRGAKKAEPSDNSTGMPRPSESKVSTSKNPLR